jgi:GMP synthase-like glutamine amidotransferase
MRRPREQPAASFAFASPDDDRSLAVAQPAVENVGCARGLVLHGEATSEVSPVQAVRWRSFPAQTLRRPVQYTSVMTAFAAPLPRWLLALLAAALLFPLSASAEDAEEPLDPAPVAELARPEFPAPENPRPLKIGVYDRMEGNSSGIRLIRSRSRSLEGTTVHVIAPDDFSSVDLRQFDVIVFPGGSGSAQARAIGESGREAVKRYVEQGGGYLGICAGAYLATAGFEWSLGLLPAKTVSPKWQRGSGRVELELTDAGRGKFGEITDRFLVPYRNGPIIEPKETPGLQPYTVAAYFRTEVANNDTPVGVMVDSPALFYGTYGRGRVFAISPHPEAYATNDGLIQRVLLWTAGEPRQASE